MTIHAVRDWFNQLPARKKGVVVTALLCVLITIGYVPQRNPYVLQPSDFKEAQAAARPELEQLARNIPLVTADGPTVALRKLYNEKPVFVYFWLTWSDTAQAELPILEDLYKTYGHDVDFLIVCLDRDAHTRQKIAADWSYTMPLYFASMDSADTYNVYSVPMYYVIHQGGKILDIHKGGFNTRRLSYSLEEVKRN